MSEPFDASSVEVIQPKPKEKTAGLATDVLEPAALKPDVLPKDNILPGQVPESEPAAAAGPERPRHRRQNAMIDAPVRPPLERQDAFRANKPPPLERQGNFRGDSTAIKEARLHQINHPGYGGGAMVLPARTMGSGTDEAQVAGEGEKGSVIAGTPRSVGEVANMTQKDIDKYPGAAGSGWPPGPQARPIVMEAFGQNWFFAKDVLLSGKWPDSVPETAKMRKNPGLATNLMWKLLAFRTYEYDGILHMLRERYKLRSPEIKKDDDILKWGSAGSVTLTSDVDVNLAGKYNMEAVGDFNLEFHKRGWGVEAGTGLDVNVYCKDNMHGFGFKKMSEMGEELKEGKPDTTAVMTINTEKNMPEDVANEERDQSNQEVAAMMKLIRFMTHGGDWRGNADWVKYRKGIRADSSTPPQDIDAKTLAKVMTAEMKYDRWRAELAKMKRDILEAGGAATDLLTDVATDHGKKAQDALDMQANNRLYEGRIEKLKELRAKLAVLAADETTDNTAVIRETAIELRQVILEAGMFANEAMITAGASNFVVFGTQVGAKKDTIKGAGEKTKQKTTDINVLLTEKQFYDAFTEQFADTIKEFHHFDRLDEGLYKGGKYLMRMTLAADQLEGVKEAKVANYEKLRTLGDYAMTAKNMNGSPEAINKVMWDAIHEQFPDLHDVNDVHGFNEIVTAFGIGVSSAYKATKAGIKVPEKPTNEADPEYATKKKDYDDALARKKGTKLKLAGVHGADLSEKIRTMSQGAVTPKA